MDEPPLPNHDPKVGRDEFDGHIQKVKAEDELKGGRLETFDDGRTNLRPDNRAQPTISIASRFPGQDAFLCL